MSIEVLRVHHVARRAPLAFWPAIRKFWEGLGATVTQHEVTDARYDYIGVGPRLQVHRNNELLASYFLPDALPHMAVEVTPSSLESARRHPSYINETHWGNALTSIFIHSPLGEIIELVAWDPDYHRD